MLSHSPPRFPSLTLLDDLSLLCSPPKREACLLPSSSNLGHDHTSCFIGKAAESRALPHPSPSNLSLHLHSRDLSSLHFHGYISPKHGPACCGSVGWASFSKAKGHQFDSWSQHLPGLWVQSPLEVHTRGGRCFSPFLPPFPLSKEQIKSLKYFFSKVWTPPPSLCGVDSHTLYLLQSMPRILRWPAAT